jgi:hypothetical protein
MKLDLDASEYEKSRLQKQITKLEMGGGYGPAKPAIPTVDPAVCCSGVSHLVLKCVSLVERTV